MIVMNAISVSCRTRSVTGCRIAVGWPDSSAAAVEGAAASDGRDGHHVLARRVVAVPAGVERGERAAEHDDDERRCRTSGPPPDPPANAERAGPRRLLAVRCGEQCTPVNEMHSIVTRVCAPRHHPLGPQRRIRRSNDVLTHRPTRPPHRAPARKKRDRTHWLYIAVIVAVVAGVAVGLLAPEVGKSVGVLGTMFVSLIKMMIAPVIFCTIVLGIGSVRKAATVGKVGGLAFVYFLVMSTFALAIGLVVGNLIHPGSGMHLSETAAGKGAELAEKAHESGGLMDFVQGIIPDTLFSVADRGQRAAGAVRRAARRLRAAGAWAARASRSCAASSTCRSWCSRSS